MGPRGWSHTILLSVLSRPTDPRCAAGYCGPLPACLGFSTRRGSWKRQRKLAVSAFSCRVCPLLYALMPTCHLSCDSRTTGTNNTHYNYIAVYAMYSVKLVDCVDDDGLPPPLHYSSYNTSSSRVWRPHPHSVSPSILSQPGPWNMDMPWPGLALPSEQALRSSSKNVTIWRARLLGCAPCSYRTRPSGHQIACSWFCLARPGRRRILLSGDCTVVRADSMLRAARNTTCARVDGQTTAGSFFWARCKYLDCSRGKKPALRGKTKKPPHQEA